MSATNQRNEIMKKTLIALAAVATLAAGMAATSTAAQAKIHVDLHLGGYGYGGGFYDPGYYYDDTPDCGWEYGPVVKWKHHHQVVVYGKHWVCN
jgi:hypothetical protein